MYQIFQDKSITDKVEIFSEVSRFIMAEAGNMIISESGVKENFLYNSIGKGRHLKPKIN
jgi:hypothetical protein